MEDNFTQYLSDWRKGSNAALEEILPIVMSELKRQAKSYMSRESGGHTLQATALVNEAFLRLVDVKISWQDRAHFFAVAANLMRRILVDHARHKKTLKAGGAFQHTSLDNAYVINSDSVEDLVIIDNLLVELEDVDVRSAKIFELHFFAGMTVSEISLVEKVSESTIARELRFVKTWLSNKLENDR